MTVVIVADVLGKENNGTTIACMNLIRSLRAKGHEVRIVCGDQDKKGTEGYYIVPTFNFGKALNRYVQKNGVVIAKKDDRILEDAICNADVVHLPTPFGLARAALKIARAHGIPVTASFHCQAQNVTSHLFLMNSSFANKIAYRNFYKHVYQYVDAIHYPTDFIRREFEQQVHKTTKAYVISNGVNAIYTKRAVEKPEELKDKFVILFIGRYSKEKTHKYLIKAVSQSRYCDRIQLIFAGAGPLEEKLIQLSDEYKINRPIMKFFSREALVDVINYSDLYCHPAQIEIEAIACLEAISCGTVPVINNSPLSATREFAICPENLFAENDSVDLAAKIDYWIEHGAEKEACAKKYLDFTVKFNQAACMDAMEQMLLEVTEQHEKKNTVLQ